MIPNQGPGPNSLLHPVVTLVFTNSTPKAIKMKGSKFKGKMIEKKVLHGQVPGCFNRPRFTLYMPVLYKLAIEGGRRVRGDFVFGRSWCLTRGASCFCMKIDGGEQFAIKVQ